MFMFIKFAVVLGDSILCLSVKFLLINICYESLPKLYLFILVISLSVISKHLPASQMLLCCGCFCREHVLPRSSGSHVCHQIYQQPIQNELRHSCLEGTIKPPGMVAKVSINFVSWKNQAVGCARKGAFMLHLESSSESTF